MNKKQEQRDPKLLKLRFSGKPEEIDEAIKLLSVVFKIELASKFYYNVQENEEARKYVDVRCRRIDKIKEKAAELQE